MIESKRIKLGTANPNEKSPKMVSKGNTHMEKLTMTSKCTALFAVAAAALFLAGVPVHAAWIAYHDLGATTGSESTGNITTHQSGPSGTSNNALDTSTKNLIKYSDGSDTGVDFSIAGANGMDSRDPGYTRPPASGTPAYALFVDGVSGLNLDNGTIYEDEDSGATTFTFSGLNPGNVYDLAFYGDRYALSPHGVEERFTLNGASSALNASSTGIQGTFVTDMETRPNATAGNVVRWTHIDPGSDGSITVTMNPIEFSGGDNIAYVSALRLEELAPSQITSQIIFEQGFDALTAGTSDHASTGGTDWGFQTVNGDTNGNVQAVNPLSSPNAYRITDNGEGTGLAQLQFDAVDVSNFRDVTVYFQWTSPGNAFDGDDFFRAEVSFDAAGSPVELFSYTGDALDSVGNTYARAKLAVPDSATTVTLLIEGQTSSNSDEFLYIDNVLIMGSIIIPEPSTALLAGLGLLGLCLRRRRRQ